MTNGTVRTLTATEIPHPTRFKIEVLTIREYGLPDILPGCMLWRVPVKIGFDGEFTTGQSLLETSRTRSVRCVAEVILLTPSSVQHCLSSDRHRRCGRLRETR